MSRNRWRLKGGKGKERRMAELRRFRGSVILILCILSFLHPGYAQEREPDVRYVPTPEEVVMEMLKMARVTSSDVVYDLGCGDGRIVITAAKVFGARGVGVDIDPVRIKESNENALKAGVTDRVKFVEGDLFKIDLSEASVVTLYLLEGLNLQLRPKLFRELKPGARIVSHEFGMDDWKPDNAGVVRDMKLYYNPKAPHVKDTPYYYWVIPANVSGTWHWSLSGATSQQVHTLRLDQKFQEVSGEINLAGRKAPISDARLVGDQLSFTFTDDKGRQKIVMTFNGRITGDAISGNVQVQRGGSFVRSFLWTAKR